MLTANIGSQGVKAYFHAEYYGMNSANNTIKYVNYLKNDLGTFTHLVPASEQMLTKVLAADFAELVRRHGCMTVVGIPRSKREDSYPTNKMGLKRGIRAAVARVEGLSDGLDYILRHTNTRTSHRAAYDSDGRLPYPGITKETCNLSPEIAGKDILLVDDIYTPTCGIDEDAISALFEAGARSVVFYAVGYTVGRCGGYRRCA